MLTVEQAFWFLAVLIGLPFPIMMMVDVDRGRAEAIALGKELEALTHAEGESDLSNHYERDVEYENQR